ncbi:hypothetical protein [aff. Roholtiella sp. LEGE 12411]|nr:hypothetical protein [aff. Roholtiella sp. LEGE 12411]
MGIGHWALGIGHWGSGIQMKIMEFAITPTERFLDKRLISSYCTG